VCCEKLCELHKYNPSCNWIWCEGNHPLLMTCFYWLNPIVEECRINEPNEQLEDDINIFGVGTFVEEFSQALVIGELSLFRRLHVPRIACEDSFPWWHINEGTICKCSFFSKQIVNIFWSQIETWQVFNLAKVLTSFTIAYKLKTLIELSMWCRIGLMIDTLIVRRR
jgi:hypothetical protein